MRGLLIAALLLAACASSKVDAPAQGAVAAPAPAPAPAPAAPVPHAAPQPAPAPAAAMPAPPAPSPAQPAAAAPAVPPIPVADPRHGGSTGVLQVPARPPAAAQPLVPPETAGANRAVLSGCLLAANEAEAARFPPPPVLRSAAPAVTVAATPGGALVTHELEHACCLKGAVASHLEGRVAIVRERLLGSPCRCRCASTLRTAVSLPPGAWTVAVEVEEAGAVRRVYEQPFQVR